MKIKKNNQKGGQPPRHRHGEGELGTPDSLFSFFGNSEERRRMREEEKRASEERKREERMREYRAWWEEREREKRARKEERERASEEEERAREERVRPYRAKVEAERAAEREEAEAAGARVRLFVRLWRFSSSPTGASQRREGRTVRPSGSKRSGSSCLCWWRRSQLWKMTSQRSGFSAPRTPRGCAPRRGGRRCQSNGNLRRRLRLQGCKRRRGARKAQPPPASPTTVPMSG